MRAETWIAHTEAMTLEKLGDALRARLLLLHAHAKRLDAAEEEPGIEWGEAAAGGVDGKVKLFGEGRVGDGEDASHDVVMS